jgi:uracil-DNA glycosylase family 4
VTTKTAHLEAIANLKTLKAVCLHTFSPAEGEQVVFGEGPEHTRLMMIGEAPGEQEAESGRPFVGNAGRLLDKYLEEAEIDRKDAYITNVLKVRPPGNRTPRKSEIKEALPFLLRQIQLVRPAILVCLGSISVQAVVDPKAKITAIRGEWIKKDGLQIMPTFHPSAVFHDESKREWLKKDLSQVGKKLKSL